MLRTTPLVATAFAALLCTAPADAQHKHQPRWKIDPHTKNDPKLMSKAGYVSYGPFEFGLRGSKVVDSAEIAAYLDPMEVLWVETAHFRIGLQLPPWPVPMEPKARKKIRDELTRLKKVLPKINPKTRVLSSWLRLHLIAMRLEDTYKEFQELLGVTDADFPAKKSDVLIGKGRFMGYGPFLGMENKYLVLVTEKTGTYLRYQKTYIGKTSAFPQRWHFADAGSLFYGLATDMEEGRLKDDTALHCNLTFNVVHSMVDGFRHYWYDLPVWIREGLAHWFQRRVDPRWNDFSQSEGGMADKRPLWKWEPYTRKLIASGKVTPFSELYSWRDFNQIKFDDHIVLWSQLDFLLSRGREKWAEFFFGVKGRVDPKTWLSNHTDLVGASREALGKAYGLTPLSLEAAWTEWVLANYAAK